MRESRKNLSRHSGSYILYFDCLFSLTLDDIVYYYDFAERKFHTMRI